MLVDTVLRTGRILLNYTLTILVNLWWLVSATLSLIYHLLDSVFTMLPGIFLAVLNVGRAVGNAFITIGCFFADVTVAVAGIVSHAARILAMIILGIAHVILAMIRFIYNIHCTFVAFIESVAEMNPVIAVSNAFCCCVTTIGTTIADVMGYCAFTVCNGFWYCGIMLMTLVYYYSSETVRVLWDSCVSVITLLCSVPYQIASYMIYFLELLWNIMLYIFVLSFSTIISSIQYCVDVVVHVLFGPVSIANDQTIDWNEILHNPGQLFVSLLLIVVASLACSKLVRTTLDGRLFEILRNICRTRMLNNEGNGNDNEDEYNGNEGNDDEHSDEETPPPSSTDSESDADANPPALARRGLRQQRVILPVNIPLNVETRDGVLTDELERLLCVICQVNHKSVLLLPCKHLCLCPTCCDSILGYRAAGGLLGQKRCPLCRAPVTSTLAVFT